VLGRRRRATRAFKIVQGLGIIDPKEQEIGSGSLLASSVLTARELQVRRAVSEATAKGLPGSRAR